MFPRNDTYVSDSLCQTRRTALTYSYRPAALPPVFDYCVNVMLRPSPSLHDTLSFNKLTLVTPSHGLASITYFRHPSPARKSFVRSDDISMFLGLNISI